MHAPRHTQHGMTLIESLIAILLFSVGILALIAMYASSMSATADAQYRVEANNLANQLISRMWVGVDRTNAATMTTTLNSFATNTAGADCNAFSGGLPGTEPGKTTVADWVNTLKAAGTGLPGAKAEFAQVLVDTSAAAYNRVTVTICWQSPSDNRPRKQVVVANIN
jgi:type IV pilus assembly protein PilV